MRDRVININITFRNTEPTDALKNYATEKLSSCLGKFAHRDTEAHVVLRVEKNRQVAEVVAQVDGSSINAGEEDQDMYASIDKLVDKLTHLLRKNKEKLTSHH